MYAAVPASIAMVMMPPHIVLGLGSKEYLSTCMDSRPELITSSQCRYGSHHWYPPTRDTSQIHPNHWIHQCRQGAAAIRLTSSNTLTCGGSFGSEGEPFSTFTTGSFRELIIEPTEVFPTRLPSGLVRYTNKTI